jgi:putative endonuclease
MYILYILLCSDNTLYTGITNNLPKRLAAHDQGRGAKYVRSRLPVKLIYSEELAGKSEALKREYEIKSWSREQKIAKLKLEPKLK